jgi:hypothetical protein
MLALPQFGDSDRQIPRENGGMARSGTVTCRLRKVGINWSEPQDRGWEVCRGPKAAGRKGRVTRMDQGVREAAPSGFFRRYRIAKPIMWVVIFAAVLVTGSVLRAQDQTELIDDITAKYHFISADDTLAVLDEEGRLKGYIDIYQNEEESDAVLSYTLIEGTRKKTHVEFRTNKIHGKFYRFSGNVERGGGHENGDPDYLRLVGSLEVVTINGDTGQEAVQRLRVVLRSFGKSERDEN